jgi:hypothetical protein
MKYTKEEIREMSDAELKILALDKKGNGNASADGRCAQEELYLRNPFGKRNDDQIRTTKRYGCYAHFIDGK